MENLKCFFVTILSVLILSCNQPNCPGDIQQIIEKSGNRSEINKLINNYQRKPEDSLKLKASYFYIRGLKGHYYFRGEQLAHYRSYAELGSRNFWHGEYIKQYLVKKYGEFSQKNLELRYQLTDMKADSVIKDIDFAMKVWHEQPWSQNYDFSYFCNYVLPFFIGNEIPEYNRESIYKRYNPLLDSLRKNNGTALEATDLINDQLRKEGWGFTFEKNFLPNLGPSMIIKYRVGNCREMANLATYVLRSLAIPVGEDFLPQWPGRNLGHNWNVLFLPENKSRMFLGVDDNPSGSHFPGTKKGKVYRNMFQINPKSLAALKDDNESVPPFLLNPFIQDVTDEYVTCFNADVHLENKIATKHVYVSLFNNDEWVPVDWADVKRDRALFKKLEGDIVYLPGYYQANRMVPSNPPFLLTKDGKIQYLTPDPKKTCTIKCDSIFPVLPHYFDLNGLVGGSFQGSNKTDFSDAVTLYTITEKQKPHLNINTISVYSDKKFRYIRYMKPKYKFSDCNLSEFHTYTNKQANSAKLIFPEGIDSAAHATGKNVVDNDLTTAYINKNKRQLAWIGLDLGESKVISSINFAAGTHDENRNLFVKPGHKYELWIWTNGDWKIHDSKTALTNFVSFNHVPANGLYRLHDISDQKRERIFLYQEGRVSFY